MSYLMVDGPAVQGSLNVSVEVEAKVGASVLAERKIITIQPIDGKIYASFQSGVEGFLIYKSQIVSFEISDLLPLYIKAVIGTVAVKICERA
jgi:hypothetical protein